MSILGAINSWEKTRGSGKLSSWRRRSSNHQYLLPSCFWQSECFSNGVCKQHCKLQILIPLHTNFKYSVLTVVCFPWSLTTTDPTWLYWWPAPTPWLSSEMPFAVSATCKFVGSLVTTLTWFRISSVKWASSHPSVVDVSDPHFYYTNTYRVANCYVAGSLQVSFLFLWRRFLQRHAVPRVPGH